jgi:uncharacterized protein
MNRNLRVYTRRNLKSSPINNFFKRFTITNWLIFVNVIVFVVLNIFYVLNQNSIAYFALQPNFILQGKYLWTFFTSMFSHFAFWHLFANMVTLMFLGGFVEKIIGKKRYIWFYLISGIIASVFFIFLSYFFGNTELGERIFGSPAIFALGASGAIFGLAGLITMLLPKLKVLVFFIIPMPMWAAMVFFLGVFWVLSAFYGLPIGNSAHFGGFICGLVYGGYLRKKYRRKVARLNQMIV